MTKCFTYVRFLRASVLLCLSFSFALLAAVQEEEHVALQKGSVLTTTKKIQGWAYDQVTSKGVVDAPLKTVLHVLRDFGHYNEFIPNVVESRILKEEPSGTRYFSKVNMPWPVSDISYECLATPLKEGHGFTFELVPGTGIGMKDFRGSWVLSSFDNDPNRTLAVYTLSYVPAKNYAPWIVKMGSKHTIEKNIDAIRDRIKKLGSAASKKPA